MAVIMIKHRNSSFAAVSFKHTADGIKT